MLANTNSKQTAIVLSPTKLRVKSAFQMLVLFRSGLNFTWILVQSTIREPNYYKSVFFLVWNEAHKNQFSWRNDREPSNLYQLVGRLGPLEVK